MLFVAIGGWYTLEGRVGQATLLFSMVINAAHSCLPFAFCRDMTCQSHSFMALFGVVAISIIANIKLGMPMCPGFERKSFLLQLHL